MRLFDIAFKDITQQVRDRKALFFLVAMPVLFTLFFTFVFGGFNTEQEARLKVGFANLDRSGSLGAEVQKLLENSDTLRPVLLSEQEAAKAGEQVRDNKLAAALIVPDGYSEQAWAGKGPRLTLIVDQSSQAGQSASQAVEALRMRLAGSVEAARLSATAFEVRRPFTDAAARQAFMQAAFQQASQAWQNPPLSLAAEKGAKKAVLTPATQFSPGLLVQFVIFGLVTTASVLLMERKSRTLGRILTTPVRRSTVLAGHYLAVFVIVLLQEFMLIAIGQLALNVNYLGQPLATGLVILAIPTWVAALGLLVGTVAKTQEQVVIWSLMLMFLLSILGGAWFSLEYTGEVFSAIGHLTPAAWAIDGLQNIVVRGQGINSALLPSGVMLLYALVFLALALWRLNREQAS